MYPKILEALPLTNYGILVALGFLLGLWITLRLARRADVARNAVVDIAIWSLICGLVGAKMALVLLRLPHYAAHPSALLGTLRYAGVFYGGLAAALLFIFFFTRRRGLPFLQITDLFAPGLAVAHAFGRMGCFLAGCCWGSHCRLPWAVTFTSRIANETVGTPLHVPLHPVQLYEAAGNLLLFPVLLFLWSRGPRKGAVTALYVVAYAAMRFACEFLRADPRGSLGPLSTSQWLALSAAGIVIAVYVLARRGGRHSRESPGAEAGD